MDNILCYMAASIILGMLFAYVIKPAMAIILISIFLILFLLFLYRKNKGRIIIFILLIFFAGMAEYTWHASFESKFAMHENKEVEIEALILDNGTPKIGSVVYNAETRYLFADEKVYNYKERILFKNYGKFTYKAGDIVKARGQAVGFITKRNFGDQDYNLYNRSRRIYNQFLSRDNELIKKSANNFKIIFLYGLRNKIAGVINSSMPKAEAAFLNAVILGDKQWIDEGDLINFQKTGLSHLLSVSGLHVAFIALMLNKLFKTLKLSSKANGLITCVLIIYYVMMIGAPPSAVRALIMMIVVTIGKNLNKEYDLLASVSFSAILMLIFNPLLIHNQGFIISYSCIYSIAYLYEPVYEKIKNVPIPAFIRKSISLSIAIQIGISPILIYYFQYFSIVNILLNIVAIPFTFAIIAIGFLGVIIGMIFLEVSLYVFAMNYYLISFLLKFIEIVSSTSFSGFYIPILPMYLDIIYYLLLLLYVNKANVSLYLRKWKLQISMTAVLLIMMVCLKYITNDDIRIVLLDVGQGDSILITTPRGKSILIDGGGSGAKGSYYYDVGSKVTVPALRKLGVCNLDTVILSHNHDDHLEGLLKVAEKFKIKNVILPKVPYVDENLQTLIRLSREKGSKLFYVKENDKIVFEENIYLKFLSPSQNIISGTSSDENNNSIVAKLFYEDFTMLLTGDIQKEGENVLLDKDVSAIVLKVPHHGSSSSSTKEFIEAVSPKISLISVGQNTYGHPSNEALENIREVASIIYRTDENGAIKIISNGRKLSVRSVR
ncbi:MAG: DNA internalization-related competence protein ComEC/Rec2 [Lutispora sp.]|nr:DNA internalization-related competence protein ComEC/Rec2 [Lutispora sp.]